MARIPDYQRPDLKATLSVLSTTQIRLLGGTDQITPNNLDLDISTSGFGGLDTGSVAASTLYYIYIVYQSGVPGLICSLSNSGPLGFSDYIKVGVLSTNSGSEACFALAGSLFSSKVRLPGFTSGTQTYTRAQLEAHVDFSEDIPGMVQEYSVTTFGTYYAHKIIMPDGLFTFKPNVLVTAHCNSYAGGVGAYTATGNVVSLTEAGWQVTYPYTSGASAYSQKVDVLIAAQDTDFQNINSRLIRW